MLYQLSYLGTAKAAGAWERAVYSQAGQPCLPAPQTPKKHAKSSSIGVFVLMLAARNRLEMRWPTGPLDIPQRPGFAVNYRP